MSKEIEEINSFFEGDFKVNLKTGEAFASLRVAGELCGVDKSTVHRYFATHNMATKQGVTPEMLQKCNLHYAKKGKPEAIETLATLSEAGAKAFIYHKAGVPMQQQLTTTSDAIELKKLDIQLAKEKTKQLEAKVKLAKPKTNINRKPTCPKGYVTMKAYERSWEDADKPIPLSVLKKVLEAYWDSVATMANCVHEGRFDTAIEELFGRFEDDGAYWKDPDTGIRTLKTKVDWL